MEATLTIPLQNLDRAREEIEKLRRKAERYGNAPIEMTWSDSYEKRIQDMGSIRVVDVSVSGEAPRIGDWTFVAYVERIGEHVLCYEATGMSADDSFKESNDGHCDHCGTVRPRKYLYVLQDPDGRQIQVGHTCLRDHLGMDTPQNVLWRFYLIQQMHQSSESEFFSLGISVSLTELQAYVLVARRLWGWVSSTTAREEYDAGPATADLAWSAAVGHRDPDSRRIRMEAQESDMEMGRAVVEWVRSSNDDSDYMSNLQAVMQDDVLGQSMGRHSRLIGSAAHTWMRQLERVAEAQQRQQAAAASRHVGAVGERLRGLQVRLTTLRVMPDRGFGESLLVKMVCGDDILTTFTSADWAWDLGEADIGKTMIVDGTVKSHNEYGGIIETQLTRVRIQKEAE